MTILQFDQVEDDPLSLRSAPAPRRLTEYLSVERREVPIKAATNEQLLQERCELLEQKLINLSSELNSVQDNLKRSNEGFQQFAYAVSHDLQSPLRAIAGFSGFLKEEYENELDDTANGYIDRVVSGVTRMGQLIKSLTLYSRVISKVVPFETVDLDEVVRDVLARRPALVDEPGAVVAVEALPTVFGDRVQLSQLFENLIENCFKFRSSSPITIQIAAKKVANEWTISISDNGIGIEPDQHESVFAMFRRLHPQQDYDGVGAGLAICRRIVDRHSGKIWVDSKKDNGCTFHFTIASIST